MSCHIKEVHRRSTCLGVSVTYTAELAADPLIFPPRPCRGGKNLQWIRAGLGKPSLGATSLVIRKYASWNKKRVEQNYQHNTTGWGDLIDGTRDEAGHGAAPERDRKGTVQGRGRLNGWKRALADVVRHCEAEDSTALIEKV
jgi:hypothetical protein